MAYPIDVIGIDEVGRGAWAGPLLVVAARQHSVLPVDVADSKVLSRAKRESMIAGITGSCDIGEGWVASVEVDEHGLTKAMQLGVARALTALEARADEQIIMDGHINYCAPSFQNVQTVIDADALYPIVSAASIYAKVTRDNHMAGLAQKFPVYGFADHVGYGTKQHRSALEEYGLTPEHRRSYRPVAKLFYEKTNSD